MALRTNSKIVSEKIRKEIMESYQRCADRYEVPSTEFNDICNDILGKFYIEYLKGDNRYLSGKISEYNLFCDWFTALPGAFDLPEILLLGCNASVNWIGDILEQSPSERLKYEESDAEKLACNLIYRELKKGGCK